MLYYLYGGDSFHALRKINEFKSAFRKKAESFLIEEYDGESGEIDAAKIHLALGQANLFSKVRLVIFRNVVTDDKKIFAELEQNGAYLGESKDVFVFWEREPEKEVSDFFKKNADKTQEIKEATGAELDLFYGNKSAQKHEAKAPNPFMYIDKMFGSRALIVLKEMSMAGIAPQQFIYAFLWKLKQQKKAEAYFKGIEAESQMKRDPKNAEEILEKFIFSLRA